MIGAVVMAGALGAGLEVDDLQSVPGQDNQVDAAEQVRAPAQVHECWSKMSRACRMVRWEVVLGDSYWHRVNARACNELARQQYAQQQHNATSSQPPAGCSTRPCPPPPFKCRGAFRTGASPRPSATPWHRCPLELVSGAAVAIHEGHGPRGLRPPPKTRQVGRDGVLGGPRV